MALVQLSTPPLFIGIASALTISVRTLGGVVGYAIAEAIYGAYSNTQIPENIRELRPPPHALTLGSSSTSGSCIILAPLG